MCNRVPDFDGPFPYWKSAQPLTVALRLSADGSLVCRAEPPSAFDRNHYRGSAPIEEENERRHLQWIIAGSGVREAGRKAEKLIAEFGTVGSVLAASSDRQLKVVGQDSAVVERLNWFRSAMLHVLRGRLNERPILADSECLNDYLRASMAYSGVECFRLLCLDIKNRLLKDEVIAQGTIDRAQVHVREVLGRVLELGAASLIVVHNHPSGDPRPSKDDLELTKKLARLATDLDLLFIDHIIISTQGAFSFRANGMLRDE